MTDPFRAIEFQQQIADGLAGTLPTSWSQATLEVRVENRPRATTFELELTGPDGEPGLPTPEVSQAIAALVTHLRRAGSPCAGVTFDGRRTGRDWRVSGRVRYED